MATLTQMNYKLCTSQCNLGSRTPGFK